MPDRDALVDAANSFKLGLAEPVQAGPHEHPPCVVDRHVAAGIGAVLALALAVYELVTNMIRHACSAAATAKSKLS
jgi:two-component sensor histidine kinase